MLPISGFNLNVSLTKLHSAYKHEIFYIFWLVPLILSYYIETNQIYSNSLDTYS